MLPCSCCEQKISIFKSVSKIYNFGLGDGEKKVTLSVPKHNWGGAFVNDSSNMYTQEMLAKKDGHQRIEEEKYLKIDILIKDAATELKMLFEGLSERKLMRGVIKIDVEGYELEVLKGIAEALPRSISAYIIFESWVSDFPIDMIKRDFNRITEVGKVNAGFPFRKKWPKFLKALSLFVPRKMVSKITAVQQDDTIGDIVLHIP